MSTSDSIVKQIEDQEKNYKETVQEAEQAGERSLLDLEADYAKKIEGVEELLGDEQNKIIQQAASSIEQKKVASKERANQEVAKLESIDETTIRSMAKKIVKEIVA